MSSIIGSFLGLCFDHFQPTLGRRERKKRKKEKKKRRMQSLCNLRNHPPSKGNDQATLVEFPLGGGWFLMMIHQEEKIVTHFCTQGLIPRYFNFKVVTHFCAQGLIPQYFDFKVVTHFCAQGLIPRYFDFKVVTHFCAQGLIPRYFDFYLFVSYVCRFLYFYFGGALFCVMQPCVVHN